MAEELMGNSTALVESSAWQLRCARVVCVVRAKLSQNEEEGDDQTDDQVAVRVASSATRWPAQPMVKN